MFNPFFVILLRINVTYRTLIDSARDELQHEYFDLSGSPKILKKLFHS